MNKASVLIFALMLAPVTMAGVYKYVDEHGNTVYTDKKPDNAPDNIEKLNVKDSYTNTMQAPVKQSSKAASSEGESDVFKQIQNQQKAQASLAESKRQAKKDAKHSINAAQKALDESKVIRNGDMFPNKNGGMRYTQQYLERIEAAQTKLNAAQKHHKKF